MYKKNKIIVFAIIFICGLSSLLHAQSQNQKDISDIFSKFIEYDSQYAQPAKVSSSGFNFTKEFSNSYGDDEANRPWNNANLESDLFLARLSYTHPSNPNLSYQASLSRGGNMYSYRNVNGECVPKQYGVNSNINTDGTYRNQWTESVWHLVCNNIAYQGSPASDPKKDKVIFHQGGAYGNIAQTNYEPFYGFQLAEHYDSALEEYSTVAWLQIGHPKATSNSDFYTEVLVWTKYRNIGNGVLQIDYAVYNFGDHTLAPLGNDFRTFEIDRFNPIYSGHNNNTHNRLYMSASNGTYSEKSGQSWGTTTQNANTDGWVAFTAGDHQNNPGTGYGFIFDNGAGTNKFGFVNATKAQNNFTIIRTDTDIFQGDLLNYRHFIAVGDDVDAIQAASNAYQSYTKHGLRNMPKSEADDASYYFEFSGNTISASNATGISQGLDLKLQPYENSFPVFVVTNSSGVSQVTSDLYSAVRAANPDQMWPWNGVTTDIKLLGFSDSRATVNEFETVTINSGDDYTFPDGTTISNITSDLYKVSFTGTVTTSIPNAEYRQYTQTHVKVMGILGIEDNTKTDKLLVYPNPTSNEVLINLENNEVNSLSVFSITGQDLTQKVNYKIKKFNQLSIDLSSLSGGYYFIRLNDKTAVKVLKL